MSAVFGLLMYKGTGNLGDEIQSLAARRFLPQVDYYFDRDSIKLDESMDESDIRLIMNGWFMHMGEGGVWPPPPRIIPLMTSFHVTPAAVARVMSKEGIEFLKRHEPIGCRDFYTVGLLRRAGVKSFFSGCLTSTLERPAVERDENLIVAVDVPEAVIGKILERTDKKIVYGSHYRYTNPNSAARFAKAESFLELYAQASCVVTTRLHCALPCLAMNTPVLLISPSPHDERFFGLGNFVFTCYQQDLLNETFYYDFDQPIENPKSYLKYREHLIQSVTSFVAAAGRS